MWTQVDGLSFFQSFRFQFHLIFSPIVILTFGFDRRTAEPLLKSFCVKKNLDGMTD